jgi:2-haloacid dehalogenase
VKPVKCFVFDAYGTLFDVHSITVALDRRFPGQGAEVSKAWRTRQLEYTWLRSLMDRYEDFWKVTESALIATCNALKLPLSSPQSLSRDQTSTERSVWHASGYSV